MRKTNRPKINGQPAIVRELQVHGLELPIGRTGDSRQRGSWGSKLLHEAERIAVEEYDVKKMPVLSGICVRECYRKHGYCRPLYNSNMLYDPRAEDVINI